MGLGWRGNINQHARNENLDMENASRLPSAALHHSVWLRKRTVNREPNRSGTGRLKTGTNRTANYSYANRMGTNRTANYSYANRMEPNRFHILKKNILSASGGSENDFRELKIKLERGINCNEWIPAQHNLPKCCRNCKWSVLAATTATTETTATTATTATNNGCYYYYCCYHHHYCCILYYYLYY